MKNPDEAIDRVLAGLREVEAPVGMERRVLARMAAQGEVRRPVFGWVLACGVVAVGTVLAVALLSWSERVPERSPILSAAAGVEIESGTKTGILGAAQNHSGFGRSARVKPATAAVETSGGMPPPPMPLTEEEKLLLQAVHQGHAADLAVLNPEVRAEQELQGDAEFGEFFATQVTDEIQTATIEIEKGDTQ